MSGEKWTKEPWSGELATENMAGGVRSGGGELIAIVYRDADTARIVSCVNALRGVPSPEAAVDAVAQLLERIVAKCQQYENAPRLEAAEQHAVNEWIERQARAALSLLRPGEDGEV